MPPCSVPLGLTCAGPSVCAGGACLQPGSGEDFEPECVAEVGCAADEVALVLDLPPRDGLPGRYLRRSCGDAPCSVGRCDALSGRCVEADDLMVRFRGATSGPLPCDDPEVPPRGFVCGSGAHCEARSECRYLERGGSAYLGCGARLSWSAANDFCEVYGGQLATLEGPEEERALVDAGLDGWIGLSDRSVEGVYVWVDGLPLGYENWKPGEQDRELESGEDCVVLKHHPAYSWRLDPCVDPKPFICEARL